MAVQCLILPSGPKEYGHLLAPASYRKVPIGAEHVFCLTPTDEDAHSIVVLCLAIVCVCVCVCVFTEQTTESCCIIAYVLPPAGQHTPQLRRLAIRRAMAFPVEAGP